MADVKTMSNTVDALIIDKYPSLTSSLKIVAIFLMPDNVAGASDCPSVLIQLEAE